MIELQASNAYYRWRSGLDACALGRVLAQVARLREGNPGDTKSVGGGIMELRIDHGPGYRVYYMRHGQTMILLHGGDKSTQRSDIKRAREIAKEWRSKP